MTRDEARALIADTLDVEFGVSSGADMYEQLEHVADEILDALFAGGEVERRYANWWKDRPQTRRVVLVSDEWKDETDG